MQTLSITEICRALPASQQTPASLRKAMTSGDASGVRTWWSEALRRPRKRFLRENSEIPLLALWSVDHLELSGRERELAASIEEELSADSSGSRSGYTRRGAEKRRPARRSQERLSTFAEVLANWLVEAASPLDLWEALAVGEILLREHDRIPPELFVRCLAQLASTEARSLHEPTAGSTADSSGIARTHTSATVCRSEAAWVQSLLLSPLAGLPDGHNAAAVELTRTLLECTDSDGFLHGSLLVQAAEFLTPFTRCLAWSRAFQQPLWREDAETRFHQCVEKCGMLLLPGGNLMPLDDGSHDEIDLTDPSEVLEQAAQLADFKSNGKIRTLIRECREGRVRSRRRKRIRRSVSSRKLRSGRKNSVSWQSDVASAALMRSDCEPFADLLVMEWHSAVPVMSLAALGLPVFTGPWPLQVEVDGRPIDTTATWNCTCWFLDDEVAFAELESQNVQGIRFLRHALLSRIGHYAVLTDSVTCEDPGHQVRMTSSISMRPQIGVERDDVTRELVLQSGDVSVRAFPLWLPDDRIDFSPGRFLQEEGRLSYAAVGQGGVTAPILLDWHPGRKKQAADWCRLTVAEARRPVTDYEASGFRFRVGEQQLLIYRSLQLPKVHRTILGLHTVHESVYGRVTANGAVEAIVQVEPSPAS
jgi:hypothetical protein